MRRLTNHMAVTNGSVAGPTRPTPDASPPMSRSFSWVKRTSRTEVGRDPVEDAVAPRPEAQVERQPGRQRRLADRKRYAGAFVDARVGPQSDSETAETSAASLAAPPPGVGSARVGRRHGSVGRLLGAATAVEEVLVELRADLGRVGERVASDGVEIFDGLEDAALTLVNERGVFG